MGDDVERGDRGLRGRGRKAKQVFEFCISSPTAHYFNQENLVQLR
jgi:hypothetical protein